MWVFSLAEILEGNCATISRKRRIIFQTIFFRSGGPQRRRPEHGDAAAVPARGRAGLARPQRVVPDAGHGGGPHRPRPATSHAGRSLLSGTTRFFQSPLPSVEPLTLTFAFVAGKGVQARRATAAEAAGDGTGSGAGGGAAPAVADAARVGTDVGPRLGHPPGEHPHAHLRQVPLPRPATPRRRPRLPHRLEGHEVKARVDTQRSPIGPWPYENQSQSLGLPPLSVLPEPWKSGGCTQCSSSLVAERNGNVSLVCSAGCRSWRTTRTSTTRSTATSARWC